MADLHSTLRTEIERRLAVARAAETFGPSPWHYAERDGYVFCDGGAVAAYDVPGDFLGPHIALHDPADAIRRYTRDLAVITRHQTRAQVYPHVPGIVDPDHCWTCAKPSPCLELVDLAESLGIEVGDD